MTTTPVDTNRAKSRHQPRDVGTATDYNEEGARGVCHIERQMI